MAVIHRWKASDLALSNGATVASVPDSIGDADAAQLNEANKPTFKTNALGSFPSIVNAASDFLRTPDITGYSGFTFIFVAKSANLTGKVLAALHQFSDKLIIHNSVSGKWTYYNGAGHTNLADTSPTDFQVVGVKAADAIGGQMTFGADQNGGDSFLGEWIEIELHDEQLSDVALASAIAAKASAYGLGGSPPTDETTVKIFLGTSRTEGVKAVSPSNSTDAPPHQYAVKRGLSLVNSFKFDNPGNDNVTPSGYLVNANDAGKFITVKNYGIGFLKLQDLIDNFATLVVTPTNGFDNKIAIIEIGCNDTVDKTAAYIFDKWQEIAALCAAAGITSYIKTIGAIGQDPAYNVVATAANAMLRADHSAFDLFIDDARNTVFADGYDSTYMESDGAHWKNNANEKNAEITKRAEDGTLVFPVITTNSLPNATEDSAYEQILSATNSPTTWQKKSGTLPSGVTFDAANHKFTGTPTQTGTFPNIVIWAIDAFGNFDEKVYALTVEAGTPPPETDKKIRLLINAPSGATAIRLKRTGGSGEIIRDIANVPAFDDTVDLEDGTTYIYSMATRNVKGIYGNYGAAQTVTFNE